MLEDLVDGFSGERPMDQVCNEFAEKMNGFLAEE